MGAIGGGIDVAGSASGGVGRGVGPKKLPFLVSSLGTVAWEVAIADESEIAPGAVSGSLERGILRSTSSGSATNALHCSDNLRTVTASVRN